MYSDITFKLRFTDSTYQDADIKKDWIKGAKSNYETNIFCIWIPS